MLGSTAPAATGSSVARGRARRASRLSLREDGMSWSDIAAKLRCTPGSARRVLAGIDMTLSELGKVLGDHVKRLFRCPSPAPTAWCP